MLSGTILIAVLILTKLGVRWRWVIDKTEFLFFVLLRESWMLIVSKKNSRSENSLQPHSVCSISCTFFWFQGQQTLKWFFLLQFKQDFPYAGYFPLGWKQLHMLAISLWDGSNCKIYISYLSLLNFH